jgi:toxin ParE1/3/4
MAGYRLASAAEIDVKNILWTSAERWGTEARHRYALLIAVAAKRIADHPQGPLTRDRSHLRPGMRSFHLRHATSDKRVQVRHPAHILFYRQVSPDLIEIVRILHERAEPSLHIGDANPK